MEESPEKLPYGADRGIYEHVPYFTEPYKAFIHLEAVPGQVYRAVMPNYGFSLATNVSDNTSELMTSSTFYDTGDSLWRSEGVLAAHNVTWEVVPGTADITGHFMSYELGEPQHDKWLFRQPLLIACEVIADVDRNILAIPIGSVRKLRAFDESLGRKVAQLQNTLFDGMEEESDKAENELELIYKSAAAGLDDYLKSEYVS